MWKEANGFCSKSYSDPKYVLFLMGRCSNITCFCRHECTTVFRCISHRLLLFDDFAGPWPVVMMFFRTHTYFLTIIRKSLLSRRKRQVPRSTVVYCIIILSPPSSRPAGNHRTSYRLTNRGVESLRACPQNGDIPNEIIMTSSETCVSIYASQKSR